MRFAHADIGGELCWSENQHINELVIESPIFLRKILRGLAYANNDALGVSFTENGKLMNFEKEIDVVYNPLRLDFNNRRAMTTLLKILVKTSLSEEHYFETNEFKTRVVQYLDKIVNAENFAFEVASGDFAIDNIAKAVNLHIVDDEDDFVELLTDYMTMMSELAGIKLFVFLNLRTILLDEEMNRLIENLKNHQLNVFLVESRLSEAIPSCERIVIDSDLCEI